MQDSSMDLVKMTLSLIVMLILVAFIVIMLNAATLMGQQFNTSVADTAANINSANVREFRTPTKGGMAAVLQMIEQSGVVTQYRFNSALVEKENLYDNIEETIIFYFSINNDGETYTLNCEVYTE